MAIHVKKYQKNAYFLIFFGTKNYLLLERSRVKRQTTANNKVKKNKK